MAVGCLSMPHCVRSQETAAYSKIAQQGRQTQVIVCCMQVEVKLRLPGAEAHHKLEQLLAPGGVATHQQVMQNTAIHTVSVVMQHAAPLQMIITVSTSA